MSDQTGQFPIREYNSYVAAAFHHVNETTYRQLDAVRAARLAFEEALPGLDSTYLTPQQCDDLDRLVNAMRGPAKELLQVIGRPASLPESVRSMRHPVVVHLNYFIDQSEQALAQLSLLLTVCLQRTPETLRQQRELAHRLRILLEAISQVEVAGLDFLSRVAFTQAENGY